MSDARPDAAEDFAANLAEFEGELDTLQTYGETALATVPESARVLLTAHDAFSYFGNAFGYEVIGIQGISTEERSRIEPHFDPRGYACRT